MEHVAIMFVHSVALPCLTADTTRVSHLQVLAQTAEMLVVLQIEDHISNQTRAGSHGHSKGIHIKKVQEHFCEHSSFRL